MVFENYFSALRSHIGMSAESIYAKWFDSLVILVVFYGLSQLVIIVSEKVILKLTQKTKTKIDDLIVRKANFPISLILILIGLRLALLPIGIPAKALDAIENIITSAIVVVITYIVSTVFDILIVNWGKRLAEKTESTVDDQLIPVFQKFIRIFVSVVGLLFVLPVWGIQIGPLLASLGIAGIAVAFALQSTLSNIFGGAAIILDKSVRVGDKIKVDGDTMGTVVEVGLRSTKIKTFDNELVTIPNGKLADAKILNYIQPDPSIRMTFQFGVAYGSDVEHARKTALQALGKVPKIQKNPAPRVWLTEMGDFALLFNAVFWVSDFDDRAEAKSKALEDIYNALNREKITIPFPTRTLYMKQE